ncbi:unnamed protein product [Musa acuminata subsp. malaccensis]|uniref:(wild Malaysian banana) hypothetical protein n=1 Tax=Musa acuminata subsp. malaccensis TaxID=214687 RepID=A0A804L8C7_MUSAM|nr:PREDICTED: serine/arginine-rich splicing factor RS31-like isoform X1 [Musa acuminata subsp. malaccensis]XP_018675697.1 PREDICTED: serine/arginine-rich splicing factor RS31-like isoform X1 [Musa acuminata subsp. malaccensis]CAG1864722.1 unnamed protein product [Musa acuminata subsp. malaccensis]
MPCLPTVYHALPSMNCTLALFMVKHVQQCLLTLDLTYTTSCFSCHYRRAPFSHSICSSGLQINAGYAFVYFEDERDAGDAIRGLDGIPFGYSRRRLSVEWSRQGDRGPRYHDGSRSTGNTRPTKTLFVINFDPIRTRVRDIESHFEPYGNITNVRIRRNFAFVQFETQEEATTALESTNMSKILDRVVSVEYAFRDDDDRDEMRGSPRRGGHGRRDDSPCGRSGSPGYSRGSPSPDYGRARSPVYTRDNGFTYDRSRRPDYGRHRSRSPARRS